MLQIEYPVPDYDAWKAAFDRDLLDREGSGVRRYPILRGSGDRYLELTNPMCTFLQRPTRKVLLPFEAPA